MTDDRIRAFIAELHTCWPSGDLTALARFYHTDVVLLPPDLGTPICGRDAVVDSYREFLEAAKLISFETDSLETYPFAHNNSQNDARDNTQKSALTCMVHLNFEIVYDLDDERYVEKGLEVYTIIDQGDDGLKIIWRSQTVLDSRLSSKSEPG